MESISFEMLLHPELLPNHVLVHILHQRQFKIDKMEQMPRETLLELFHQYCTPHSQRKYRDTARGKILNKNRNINEFHQDVTNTSQSQLLSQNMESLQLERSNGISNRNRLKTPPDLVSKVKKIKLHNNSLPKCTHHYGIEKRKINNEDLSMNTPPEKKKKTLITWP